MRRESSSLGSSSRKDMELLSAYIDGELSAKERIEIEQKLKLSQEFQQELEKLKKIKKLTASSSKKLDESPYFEARLMAKIHTEKGLGWKIKKWSPVWGFGLLTLLLMLFLKYNPGVIDEIVDQQATNLAGFYKENLKPLLFAADLTNEDIFNFAFYNQLPLDKNEDQYLQLGYGGNGDEFFEIKTAVFPEEERFENFISALKLNEKQKEQMDSILDSYKEELQTQVLVNEQNTVAINPNLWNYNKAIVADLLDFAENANKAEFAKIVPASYPRYKTASVQNIISEVKAARPNQYIFFTPDTIFSEEYYFDKKKFKNEIKAMEGELKQADKELKKTMEVTLRMENNFKNLQKDPAWNNNFKVEFDTNFFRVHISNIQIPEIILPDFDSITAHIAEATRHVRAYSVNVPKPPKVKGYYRINTDSLRNFNFDFEMPKFDSLNAAIPMNLDSLIKHYTRGFNFNMNMDSIVSGFNFNLNDSMMIFEQREFQKQMRDFEKEMRKFRDEMHDLRKDLKKDSIKDKQQKKSIEI